ncbi:MAG: cytochrome c biogenesis protein ResB [Caldimicrobium sp.]
MKKFWDQLASAKLAIVLFFVLAAFSILGTIIPQGQPEAFYLSKYGEGLGKIILLFQINDAYYSWWYISALFLFLANLTACSLKRLPFTLKLYKKDPSEVNPRNLPNKLELNLTVDFSRLVSLIQNKLSFKTTKNSFQEGELFYKQINRFAYFSVYFVHFSLIVVIIGALIGSLLGYRGNMEILEGETSNIVQPFRKKEPIYLDFSVKLNQFVLETYPNGMPKEYISNVTFIDGNRTMDAIIKVNQPVKYKDITFYQASYNMIPEFKIKYTLKGDSEEVILSPFKPISIKNRYSVALKDYGQAHGFIYLRVWIIDEKTTETSEGLIISGFPPFEANLSEGKLTLEFVDVGKIYYSTGLQVKRDPGKWVVYLGFILMMFGLFLVYYYDPQTYWIYLKRKDKSVKVLLGAYAKRERLSLKYKISELANKLQKEISS